MNAVMALARPEIAQLQPYAPAARRRQWVKLNANELPWPGGDGEAGLNRYPDGRSGTLTARLAAYLGVDPKQVLVTRGSDDAIDLLVRAFCNAGRDSILVPTPGFAMYAVAAAIQGAEAKAYRLERAQDFRVDCDSVMAAWQPGCKLVFLCSPGNPTGNVVGRAEIEKLCAALLGRSLVVVDEAYIEFAEAESAAALTRDCPNLVVLRTMSKAHALAASRVGAMVAAADCIRLVSAILPPYPISSDSQAQAISALSAMALARTARRVQRVRRARETLRTELCQLPFVSKVWASEANFVLVQSDDATAFIDRCRRQRVLVRDFSNYDQLTGCVRITVGSANENAQLLLGLRELSDVC